MDNCIIFLIAFVIISSYLFKLKSDTNTKQLLYVFLGLCLIVMFKYHSNNKSNEGFTNPENQNSNETLNSTEQVKPPQNWNEIESVTSDNFKGLKKIVAYLKGVNETDINKEETQRLVRELSSQFNKFEPDKLDNQLSQITTLLTNLQSVSNLTTTPESSESAEDNILENRSLRESQFLQDMEIKKLENELSELNKLYTGYLDNKAKKVYKKIPVYSSCVMEANGTTSTPQKISDYGFETAEQIEKKKEMILQGQGEDPNASPLDKLIKVVNKGGINISLQS